MTDQRLLPPYSGGIVIPGNAIMENDNLADESEVYSPIFTLEYPGVDILGVPNVGFVFDPVTGAQTARPVVHLTDLLQFLPNNAGMGLVDENPGDPNEALWVTSLREDAIPAIKQKELVTILEGDMHLDPQAWNLGALTGYKITLDRLHPDEQRRVRTDPVLSQKALSGERLTVGEYFRLIGEVVSDKEDFNFIPHCRQHHVRYIQSAQALLNHAAQQALHEQRQKNLPRPTPHVFRDHKTGLGMKSPSDAFGLGGNNFYPLMKAAYRGVYTDGPLHRGQKVAVVGGTAAEYSLRALIAELVDLDFFVIWMLPWSGTMGVDSLLSVTYEVVSKYSKKVMPTWDWPDPLFFGPEPSGFGRRSQLIRAQAYLDEFGEKNSPVYDLFQQLLNQHRQMTARQETAPFALDRLTRLLAENNFAGEKLYWTMPEIMHYLRAGGVK